MNERYLFRGKRKDNGEWVIGYYVCVGSKYHYILTGKIDITKKFPEFEKHEVLPETVGQFTGLKDKNGKLIFEGDIVKFKKFKNEYIGTIAFNDISLAFEIWTNIVVGAYGEKATHKHMIYHCDEIEVIGNIHDDNPELLEVSK